VEVADCVKPALKSVQEMEIRKRGRCRIIGFRIQMGSKTSYACCSSKVKKSELGATYVSWAQWLRLVRCLIDHRQFRLFIDRQFEYVGPGIVAGHIKVESASGDLGEIEFCKQSAFLFIERAGQNFTQRGDDDTPSTAHDFRQRSQLLHGVQVRRIHGFGHKLVAA